MITWSFGPHGVCELVDPFLSLPGCILTWVGTGAGPAPGPVPDRHRRVKFESFTGKPTAYPWRYRRRRCRGFHFRIPTATPGPAYFWVFKIPPANPRSTHRRTPGVPPADPRRTLGWPTAYPQRIPGELPNEIWAPVGIIPPTPTWFTHAQWRDLLFWLKSQGK